MLFEKLLKTAHQHPETRVHLVPLIRQILAGRMPSRWPEFLDARYDGGKRKVPNPNPATRKTYPDVALSTAIKYEVGGRKPVWEKVLKEYDAWLKQSGGNTPKNKVPKEADPVVAKELFKKDSDKYFGKYVVPLFDRAEITKAVKPLGLRPTGKGTLSSDNRLRMRFQQTEDRWAPYLEVVVSGSHYTEGDGAFSLFYQDHSFSHGENGDMLGEPKKDKDFIHKSLVNFLGQILDFREEHPSYRPQKPKENKIKSPKKPKSIKKPTVYKFPKGRVPDSWEFHPSSNDDSLISQELSNLNKHLDKPLNKESLAKIAGMPFVPWKEKPVFSFRPHHGRVRMHLNYPAAAPFDGLVREFGIDGDNQPYIYNDVTKLEKGDKKPPEGTGSRIFANQVGEAQAAGFKYIKNVSFMDPPEWVGALVWAKLGYDGEIPIERGATTQGIKTGPLPKDLEERMVSKGFKKPYMISHLWKTEGGPEWWEKNAQTFEGKFDLTEGSYSMKHMKSYVKAKAEEAGVSQEDWLSGLGTPPKRSPKKTATKKPPTKEKGYDQIDLEKSDDLIFQKYWKKLQKS